MSSPFTVDRPPDGYRSVAAGTGTAAQAWGDDGEGTNEPFTALERDDVNGEADLVLVSVTGFEGYQGGLSQASGGTFEDEEAFSLDGRRAIFHPPGEDGRGRTWADLVVELGDDLAVRVTAPEASRQDLVSLFERVEPRGRVEAPSVETPAGMRRIGSVDAHAAVASWAYVAPNTDQVPGSEAAHGIGWVSGADAGRSLALLTLPGETADLDALAHGAALFRWDDPTIERGEVEGRRYLVVEEDRPPEGRDTRTIWMEAPWGDLIVVRAVADALPTKAELLDLAASVQQADEETWEALVIESTGGPGLHADEGRTELARGAIGNLEWLLQNGPQGGGGLAGDGIDPNSLHGVDPCVKLSNRKRACPGGGGGGSVDDWIFSSADVVNGLPPFVVLSTTLEAASVQVTTRTDQARATLVPVPGGGLWAAVVFVDHPGPADGSCNESEPLTAPPEGAYPEMRVDALDADGQAIGCLGLGPGSHFGGI